ncbi:MAG: hypothetical protein OT477_05870 [Chloroflexi bacterium]|nr:hypothetical protein [Chloroflexota bacterium]
MALLTFVREDGMGYSDRKRSRNGRFNGNKQNIINTNWLFANTFALA